MPKFDYIIQNPPYGIMLYFKFINDDRFISKMDLSEDEQKLLNEISDNLNLLNKDNVLSKIHYPLRNFLTSDKYKNLIETSND